MKYYIVYFDSITQYGITNTGYYVSYKSKIEDNYSENHIDAKKYKNLGHALGRLRIDESSWVDLIRYNTKIDLLFDNIKQKRLIKLNKINKIKMSFNDKLELLGNYGFYFSGRIEILDVEGNHIDNLGRISNKEIYNYVKKKFSISELSLEEQKQRRSSTQEEVDDFLNISF